MNKFKPGDVVVKVRKTKELGGRDYRGYQLGQKFTIIAIDGANFGSNIVKYNVEKEFTWVVFEDELELEAVYNSPLYQALL